MVSVPYATGSDIHNPIKIGILQSFSAGICQPIFNFSAGKLSYSLDRKSFRRRKKKVFSYFDTSFKNNHGNLAFRVQ